MGLRVVTPPAVEPVSVEEMKEHLGVTLDLDDALIGRLLVAARQYVERYIGAALIETTFEQTLDRFPSAEIAVERGPLMAVASVRYTAAEGGDEMTVAPSDYEVDTASEAGWIVPAFGFTWPRPMRSVNAIRIRFTAGMAADASGIDELLRSAIMELAAWWYEQREAAIEGSPREIPFGFASKLASYKSWNFG